MKTDIVPQLEYKRNRIYTPLILIFFCSGYIMFYVRSPRDNGEDMIGSALSLLWMVVHSVQGIMFKDLKQILRKEQVRFIIAKLFCEEVLILLDKTEH